MKTRIYLVTDGDATEMTDEQFMTTAENQGTVWSSWKTFMEDFNNGFSITSETDFIREIAI